jgi:hypothetical protein
MKAGPKAAHNQTPLPFCPRSLGAARVREVLRAVCEGSEGHWRGHNRCGCVTGSGIWWVRCSTRTRSRVLVTDLGGVGDTHDRRPVKRRAVGVERRPVHRLIDLCRTLTAHFTGQRGVAIVHHE